MYDVILGCEQATAILLLIAGTKDPGSFTRQKYPGRLVAEAGSETRG